MYCLRYIDIVQIIFLTAYIFARLSGNFMQLPVTTLNTTRVKTVTQQQTMDQKQCQYASVMMLIHHYRQALQCRLCYLKTARTLP